MTAFKLFKKPMLTLPGCLVGTASTLAALAAGLVATAGMALRFGFLATVGGPFSAAIMAAFTREAETTSGSVDMAVVE
jgi:hypothetical protein